MDEDIEIIIGKTAGFCYGVKRAVNETLKKLNENNIEKKDLYCLGEIVHNNVVVEKLKNNGLKVIEKIDGKILKQDIIIRAHGIPPKTYNDLEKLDSKILDLTCPHVVAIQKQIEKYSNEGYYIIITGKKEHPEVIGLVGYGKYVSVIEKIEEVDKIIKEYIVIKETKSIKKVVVLSQTTFSDLKYTKISERIKQLLCEDSEIILKNTVCEATKIRQEETNKLSKSVGVMIIVGGKNSSNTKKLYEIANTNCFSVCVETKEELNMQNIKEALIKKNIYKVGIMAGASTPAESIKEVEECLRSLKI